MLSCGIMQPMKWSRKLTPNTSSPVIYRWLTGPPSPQIKASYMQAIVDLPKNFCIFSALSTPTQLKKQSAHSPNKDYLAPPDKCVQMCTYESKRWNRTCITTARATRHAPTTHVFPQLRSADSMRPVNSVLQHPLQLLHQQNHIWWCQHTPQIQRNHRHAPRCQPPHAAIAPIPCCTQHPILLLL